MIEVKVILHNANTGVSSEIANMTIVNDATGDPELGNYDVKAWAQPMLTRGRIVYQGRVERHWRWQSVLLLVEQAIAGLHK